MELAFIWIENYRCLKDLNINFSNDFEFYYDTKSKTLSQRPKTEISTSNFWGNHILNLTAIIGENGVGKTSLFNFLKIIYQDLNIILDGSNRKLQYSKLSYIAIFKINNKYYQFANGVSSYVKTTLPNLITVVRQLSKLKLIYYSNFFDYSSLDETSSVIDLSTNSLVSGIIQKLVVEAEKNGDVYAGGKFQYLFKTTEIISQLELISNFDKHIPFQIPNQLSVAVRFEVAKERYLHEYDLRPKDEESPKVNKTKKSAVEEKEHIKFEAETEEDYEELSKQSNRSKTISALEHIIYRLEGPLLNKYSNDQIRLRFKRLLQQAVLINFFEDVVFHKNLVVDEYLNGFNILKAFTPNKLAQQEELDDLFRFVLDKVSSYLGIKLSSKGINTWIDRFVEIITRQCEFIPDKDLLNIQLLSDDIPRFRLLLKELTTFPFSPILDIYWNGISSGENAFVTLFSRIYQMRKTVNKKDYSVILLLDESEINFHPDWQRRLVKHLTLVIPEMLPLCSLQFIISSHSPLILSDIPKSNVIFLEKSNSTIQVSQLSDRKQTFAANIHTLLSDAFFMKEGTIGDLAKEKINWVIDQLNSRYAVFEQNITEIKKIVDLIGEPVIRAKLAGMINEKLEINLHNIDTRLKDLERKSKK